jgi:hypothetical protein
LSGWDPTFREEALRPLSIGGRDHQITPVFRTYWRFAAERQAIFFRRLKGILPVTDDPILSRFKFTNVYRVLDRTTQYLVREVIGECEQTPAEVFFRIVLFKLFNKIETWELLLRHFGDIRFSDFKFEFYDDGFDRRVSQGTSDLFSGLHHAFGRAKRRKQETSLTPPATGNNDEGGCTTKAPRLGEYASRVQSSTFLPDDWQFSRVSVHH